MIEQNDLIHDIEVEVHHVIIITIQTTFHKTDTALHLQLSLALIKVLLLHNTLVHYMTFINEIPDHIAPFIDLHTNHPIDVTPKINYYHNTTYLFLFKVSYNIQLY